MKLHKDLREFIELLNAQGVKYLIVGGYAVAFHGRPRLTGDTDFFVECSSANAHRVVVALQQFGFDQAGISVNDLVRAGVVIQLGYAPNRIDIVTSIDGVGFDEAWSQRVASDLDGVPVQFISKDMLIRNKKASGRPQDMADADALADEAS